MAVIYSYNVIKVIWLVNMYLTTNIPKVLDRTGETPVHRSSKSKFIKGATID